ncbi:MAG TPA: ATP-binding protein, partial [Humisphaera sp.]|nr:ATP-binding protein [Humisphaera sp.]
MESDPAKPDSTPHRRHQLTVRSKLRLSFGALLLVLLTASGMGVIVLSHYNRTFNRIFHENYDSVSYCHQMNEALDALNEEAQRQIWDASPAAPSVITDWETQFTDNITKQRHNCFLYREQEKSDAVAASFEKYRRELAGFRDGTVGDRRDFYRLTLLPHVGLLRNSVQELIAMNLRNMVDVDGQVRRTMDAVRSALLIVAAAGLLLAILFVVIIGPAMLRPLSTLTRSAQQIAEGQLDLSVDVPTRDELGQLAAAFNMMAERLREARQRDRDRLARTEQTTQMAIDSLPDAVVVLGANGDIELTNRSATDLFGLTPRGATPPPSWLTALFEQVIETGQRFEPKGYRSAIQRFSNGDERFYLPHAVPLRANDGRTVGVTVISADVTHLKHADEAKSDLVSTVSHELRTPLTSIRMAVHMLAEETFGAPLVDQQKELLRTACDNSDRLHRILESLLSISRIESGRAPLKLEPVQAREIVSHAIAPLQSNFADAGVRLLTDVSSEVMVMADMSCVGHVLTNLLSNALRFSSRGGEVRVSCACTTDQAVFTVSDDGPGIADEHIPHLFEKFYRVATPSHPAGAGLGLAIAKEIVAAHGGAIAVESQRGHGASFVFSLPLHEHRAIAPLATVSAESG